MRPFSVLRSALHPLVQRPAYALVVIAGLALGIGANTSIFSLVHGVLLQPLPYQDADRLMTVWENHSQRDGPVDEWTGYATFRDWRQDSQVFDSMAAFSGWAPNLGGQGGGEPEQLNGMAVTHEWFRVFGAEPQIGRTFSADEDLPGADSVALISHGLWQRRFDGDPQILGRPILLDDRRTTVLGILPADHEPLIAGVEIWRPLGLDPGRDDRGAYFIQVIGRLKPGIGVEQATRDMDRVADLVAERSPAYYEGVGVHLIPLHERVVGSARPALLALSGAVFLLLLVTCVNVANLLLVQTLGRRQELAIRAGLGASRGHLIGRLLAESAVLAALGGGAGLLVASWGVQLLVAMAPQGTPRIDEVTMNPTVAAFAVGLSIFTGLGFGVLPALRASRLNLAEALRSGSRTEGGSQGRLRSTLVVAETAIALALLLGAGLLVKSFWTLTRVDVGFDTERVISTSVRLPADRYPEQQQRIDFFERLTSALEAHPGVERAAASTSLPMTGAGSDFSYYVEGTTPAEAGHRPTAWYRMVTPEYFETLGIQRIAGEPFDRSHRLDTPKVIAVSQRFAQRWFGDESPLGRRMKIGGHDSEQDWMTIIAVVSDVRDRSPMLPTRDDVYLHHGQWGNLGMNVVWTQRSETDAIFQTIDDEIKALDPALSASSPTRLAEVLSNTLWLPRLASQVLTVFAAVALALAALGLYGVLSYAVQARRREMGIRAALGADRRAILGIVLRQGLTLAGLGVAIGAAVSAVFSGVLESLLYGVDAMDPQVFGLTAIVLLATAALAAWLPAHRAAATDPATCLRQD